MKTDLFAPESTQAEYYPTSNPLALAIQRLRQIHGSGQVSAFYRACREIHEVHQSLFDRGEVEK